MYDTDAANKAVERTLEGALGEKKYAVAMNHLYIAQVYTQRLWDAMVAAGEEPILIVKKTQPLYNKIGVAHMAIENRFKSVKPGGEFTPRE